MLEVSSVISTLSEALNAMAPFAGGLVPAPDTTEYANWVRWLNQKQEEFARRGFWARCLTRLPVTLAVGETAVLPVRFNRPNALFMLIVDGVDWKEPENSADQSVLAEFVNDITSANFGLWQMRFKNEIEEETDGILWYFSNPPTVSALTDKFVLPGDMLVYAALQEYFRTSNQEGYEDESKNLAENRFKEYLSIEVLPDKQELLTNSEKGGRVDRLGKARSYYSSRPDRYTQW